MSDLRKKFGELLKLERERKEIKLESLAEQLKISPTHLQSIENGDAKSLPSELYYGLFAKSYAEAIGIDYARTMEAMKAELEETGEVIEQPASNTQSKKKGRPEKAPSEKSEKSETAEVSDGSGIFKWLLYIFGGLALLFVIFLLVNHFFLSSRSTTTEQSENQTQTAAEQSAAAQQQLTSEAANFNWHDTVSYEVPQKLKLSILAKDQSWCTIVADGDTALFRNLIPGRQYDVEASYRLLVSIGIPSVVAVKLNGIPVELTDPQSGRVSRVEVSQANLHKFLNPSSNEPVNPSEKQTKPVNSEESSPTPKQQSTDSTLQGGTGDGD